MCHLDGAKTVEPQQQVLQHDPRGQLHAGVAKPTVDESWGKELGGRRLPVRVLVVIVRLANVRPTVPVVPTRPARLVVRARLVFLSRIVVPAVPFAITRPARLVVRARLVVLSRIVVRAVPVAPLPLVYSGGGSADRAGDNVSIRKCGCRGGGRGGGGNGHC